MSNNDKETTKPTEKIDYEKILPVDKVSETTQSITINGQAINYTTTTGTMVLKEEDGKPKASFFFIAYTRSDIDTLAKRPITFSFNGGPGSSSVWLHLGLLGPKRVPPIINSQPPAPPYTLKNNPHSLLDVTDLVFIDPISTGYSRPAPDEEAKQFHGVEEDIQSVAKFIHLYTTRYQRWASPKYLIGESYGTTRAAGLSGFLQEEYGMYLNGVMLVSSILNFQTARFNTGNDLPYILFLPTYTATAWYHQKLATPLQKDLLKTLAKVESFAETDYTLALMKGAKLSAKEKTNIINKLAKYTGLSTTYIEHSNLRLNIHRFVKELLRDQRRTVGRLDSRFTGIDRDAVGEKNEYDPSYALLQGVYSVIFNHYVRTELGYESDLPYNILADVYQSWNYNKHANQYLNVGETLRKAITQNPHLKVFIANGYYDLATPYFATEYTFNHLHLDPTLQKNITMTYYEGGHMMYIDEPIMIQLNQDLRDFVNNKKAQAT